MTRQKFAAVIVAVACFAPALYAGSGNILAACPTTISTAKLPDGVVGQPYKQQLAATGGKGPYTFAILPTTPLPPGLSLLASATANIIDTIGGTPTTAGTSTITVQATDLGNPTCVATKNLNLTVAPTCPTTSSRLVAPANGAILDGSKSVTFNWASVSGANSYDVLYSSDGGATFTRARSQTTSVTVPLAAGAYVASVRTNFSAGCSTGSPQIAFTVAPAVVCPTAAPAPLTPANGASTSSTSVTFSWTTAGDSITYALFTSLNGGPFTQLATTRDLTTNQIVPVGTIDWYVVAQATGCAPLQSVTSRFAVTAPPPQCGTGSITLVSPVDESTVSSPVTFAWTPVVGATAYRVWLGASGAAADVIARVTTTTATLQVPSGKAEWYVEALFDNCPSVVSLHREFTVQQSSTCGAANPAPTLVSPLSGDVDTPVTFQWNAASGAIGYRVWVVTSGQAPVQAGSTTDTKLQHDLQPGNYTWFVEALFPGCTPVSSATASFRVRDNGGSRCSTDAPNLIAPANNATATSPVTFAWTSVSGASEYRVFASLNGDEAQLIGSTTDTTFTSSVPAGRIDWFVEAASKGCAATRSSKSRFTIPQAANCPTSKPQLLSPADGAGNITSPVTFSWTSVSGAIRYVVVVKGEHGAETVLGDTTGTQLQRDLPGGSFEWYVLALGSGCDPVRSENAKFDIPSSAACAGKPPHPLAPADDSISAASPVHFSWTQVDNASSYRVFMAVGSADPTLVTTTAGDVTDATLAVPSGRIRWSVEATFDACPAVRSAWSDVTIAAKPTGCAAPATPVAHVVAQVLSGTDYNVRWTGVTNGSIFEIQEATSADFADATTQPVSGVSAKFHHTATAAAVRFFYRVRAFSGCSNDVSAYSRTISTRVVPPNTVATRTPGAAEIGFRGGAVQTLTLPGSPTPRAFTASVDKPWLSVSPSSGTIPPEGLTLTVTSDPRALNVGANHGTIRIAFPGASTSSNSRHLTSNGSTPPTTIPISISLVTPVAPDTKATPLPDSLIIPAVAHGPGANGSLFQSDIRLANVSSQAMTYLLNFTPSATDGTQTGITTTIQVDPGVTTALDDILSSFFGTASTGSATGMLEIRPLTDTQTSPLFSLIPSNILTSVASSRTYNVTSLGTFGQFIPAIPFAQFVGKGDILSLQQIAQSVAYRTNFGLVEAAGEPADVIIHVFDKLGNLLADIPESLLPSEHLVLNGLLIQNNITLDDGRVEIEVVSSTGKVTGYASVLDNATNDPLLVSAILKSAVKSNRYVVPGVAYTNGVAHWRTDARLFNAGTDPVDAKMTFYPEGAPGSSMTQSVTIAPGETRGFDNILNATFGIADPSAGGSVVVETPATSNLIASARTYAQTDTGTIGQFIPAVTPADSVGVNDRALQILQLEQSDAFRTNIGLAETTGNAATVEVSLVLPDSKVTPVLTYNLAANEFRQIRLADFALTDSIYNARVAVKVVDGAGKVTAYGSLIDNTSQDPTYVPAQ